MRKILLVEDNEVERATRWRAGSSGATMRSIIAVDGYQAVSLALRPNSPDLILMDLGLPGIDGWDATAQLKMDPETRHIPIVVLSAHAMPNDRHQALAAGGDDFDTKPVQFDRLLEKIRTLLATNGDDVSINQS